MAADGADRVGRAGLERLEDHADGLFANGGLQGVVAARQTIRESRDSPVFTEGCEQSQRVVHRPEAKSPFQKESKWALGGSLEFRHEDFYAGIRLGGRVIHLKLVDEPDPSIEFVREGEHFDLYLETDDIDAAAEAVQRNGVRLTRSVCETAWGTREFTIEDDQGHTLYFGARA